MFDRMKHFIKKYFMVKIISPVKTPVLCGHLLEDKVALIFGGSGGIGAEIASKFVKNGSKVVITGRNEQHLIDICSKLGNDCANYVVADVLNIENINEVINSCVSSFGKIDILVYSAGTHCRETFGFINDEIWNNVMDVNLKGMYFVCQEVSKYMIANQIKGHILTVGSASCTKPGWTPYEISKAGVKSLTLGIADKLIKHGIIVNSIAPGPVATSMLDKSDDSNLNWPGNPSKRMCTPEEVANIALIMVSSLGDMVVGDTYFISGGSGTICIDK